MQTIAQTIRLGILLIACLAVSACETMKSFYEEVIVASVNETIIEPVKDTELSYCYGCDWIVQEFHGGKWETRNSQPFPGRPLNELPHFAQLIRDLRCSAEIDERAILV